MTLTFLMAGGGTGGHVMPALAVARELKRRGHEPFFVGTPNGLEAKLVPSAGFPIEWIEIGGLKRVGAVQTLRTACQLPRSTFQVAGLIGRKRPSAIFSLGGYVAGPVMFAGLVRRLPMVVMEPNALPGMTNRRMGRFIARALVNFPETVNYFPPGRAEVTGVPIRAEFFALRPKPRGAVLTVLITGGSRGSRTLNHAARDSWPLFSQSKIPVRFLHQTVSDDYEELARQFAASGVEGEIAPFMNNMPAKFAEADLIVCRSGAGAVAEVAAAGKPAIFVPFPYAADNHQQKNAEALAKTGAAGMVLDAEFNGERFFREVTALAGDPERMAAMGEAARQFGHPHAAERAADILEELANRV